MNNIKPLTFVVTLVFLVAAIEARNDDQFNFGETIANPSGNGFDFGPAEWDKVTCDDLGSCLGFPDTWEGSIGWTPDTNICRSCPAENDLCFQHRQSPIDLKRDRALAGSENEKTCPDWHYIKYEDGACTWEDLVNNDKGAVDRNNFFIRRHALQYTMPLTNDGLLACFTNETKQRRYPRLDYSKGFPDWFHLSHTEIIVPSVHTQEGKRYDAEVHLAHFYEVDDIDKNKIGKIALFLEAFEGKAHWEFLDKLICQWRETEEQTRKDCGLSSVPDYIGCRNPLRGRTATPTATPTIPSPVPSVPLDFNSGAGVPNVSSVPANATPSPVQIPGPTETLAPGLNTSSPVQSPVLNGTLAPVVSTSSVPAAPLPVQIPVTHGTLAPVLDSTSPVQIPVTNGTLAPGLNSSSPVQSPVLNGTLGLVVNISSAPATPLPVQSPVTNGTLAPVLDSTSPAQIPVSNGTLALVQNNSSPVQSPVQNGTLAPVMNASSAPAVSPANTSVPTPSSPPLLVPVDLPSFRIPFFDHPSVHAPVTVPSSSPTAFPIDTASLLPSLSPSISSLPSIECDSSIRFDRVCKAGGCCDETRSATNDCTAFYDYFGQDYNAACWYCCDQPKIAADPAPQHPVYERIECSAIDSPNRICRDTSCCDVERSSTNYCKDVYQTYPGDLMGSICWYCCSEPKEVGPPLARNLRVVDKSRSLPAMLRDIRHFSAKEIPQVLVQGDPDEDVFDEDNPFANAAHADERMTRIFVDDSNRKQFDRQEFEGDEDAYMKAKIETFRKLEALSDEQRRERRLVNYDHIPFNSYEWMLAVKTEYYFRYEGTFATPPCSEVVHWRVMKDPIQVHPDQIKELERLLAWRIAPKGSKFKECQRDTAGKDRPGRDGNAVDLNRPIQSTRPLHRMVFCECQDWRSKFDEDRQWCRRGVKTRLYSTPYGFSEVLPATNGTIATDGTHF